jgi:hypothetical protein
MGLTISLGLRKAKDLKNKLSECDSRIRVATVWAEENPPVWQYEDLVKQRAQLVSELCSLKARIARANAMTLVLLDGQNWTLGELVAVLAELKGEIALISGLHVQDQEKKTETASSWEPDEHDYQKRHKVTTTVTTICSVTTKKKAELVEQLKARFAVINDEVETINHQTQLPAASR